LLATNMSNICSTNQTALTLETKKCVL
jgi:hypothetical protein